LSVIGNNSDYVYCNETIVFNENVELLLFKHFCVVYCQRHFHIIVKFNKLVDIGSGIWEPAYRVWRTLPQEAVGGSQKNELWWVMMSLVGFSAVSSIHYFDVVGWWEKDTWPVKNCRSYSQSFCFWGPSKPGVTAEKNAS